MIKDDLDNDAEKNLKILHNKALPILQYFASNPDKISYMT